MVLQGMEKKRENLKKKKNARTEVNVEGGNDVGAARQNTRKELGSMVLGNRGRGLGLSALDL